MRIGVAADHGGFELKQDISSQLKKAGYEVQDYGALAYDPEDDYPDLIIPLARAVAAGEVERGIAFCGSGVGACIAANKVKGARASIASDIFSAKQGVEDDDMNILCIGGRILGPSLAWELLLAFLGARFKALERFQRRLDKVIAVENE
jgi:ribose 5-phosphate isomerase B